MKRALLLPFLGLAAAGILASTHALATERPPRRGERDPERTRDDDPRTGDGPKINAGPAPVREPQPPRGPRPEPAPPPPAPGLPPEPIWIDAPITLACEEAWVCFVDPLDAYVGWMLVRQTHIPWLHFVAARADGRSWSEVTGQLELKAWELYAALDAEPGAAVPNDPTVRELALEQLVNIDLREFSCELPVVLEVSPRQFDPRGNRRPDWVDRAIAERIHEETGWCVNDLLTARMELGSWARTARSLYLSPFLFEASFGIELETRRLGSRRRAEYPRDEEIRDVVERERWPETQ